MNRYLLAEPGLIEDSEDVTLTVNPPERKEVVITRENAWERVLLGLYSTVIDDHGVIRLWYGCRSGKENTEKHTAYAESTDGVNFEKRGIVIPETMEGMTYLDPNEVEEKRFGYFGNLYGKGLYRWTSPDGIRFVRDEHALLQFESDTQNVMVFDENAGRYIAFVRGWDREGTKNDWRRTVMRFDLDRVDEPWTVRDVAGGEQRDNGRLPLFHDESDVVLRCDAHDPEDTDIYTMTPLKYGTSEGKAMWIAFPAIYRHFIEPEGGHYINAGRVATLCAGSRDGIRWSRYDRGSYATPQQNEHMLYMGHGLVEHGDEIWQYGIAYNTHHGEVDKRLKHGDGTMYRFIQRRDGFVSADSGMHGTLTTDKVTWSGEQLYLNIDTDGLGVARVGVLDEKGEPIHGYGVGECKPVMMNDTKARVTWNTGDGRSLKGCAVKLRIESTRTKLFSFGFTES